jgi:small GTP-binding protein
MSTDKNIVMIGDSGLDKFHFPTESPPVYRMNIDKIRVNIWDIGGKEMWDSIRKDYYKYADGAVIMFDETNNRSYNNVPKWYNEVIEARPDIPLLIIAKQSDLKIPVNNTDDPWVWLARKLK